MGNALAREHACPGNESVSIARRSDLSVDLFPWFFPTLADLERPQPELLLSLAGFHLHGAEGRVESEVAAADGQYVLLRDGAAVEPAAAPGEFVRTELAGRLEVTVDVLAGLAFLCAGHVGDGGGHASHRGRRLGRC